MIGGLAGIGAAAAGGTGLTLVDQGVLPGKVRLDRALGRCGDLPVPPAATTTVRTLTLRSARRRTDVAVTIVPPSPGAALDGMPVAIALHGNGGTGAATVRGSALDRYLPHAVAHGGVPPFAVVAVDGGGDTYWHARANGDDPLAMIVDELLPLLREQGADVGRVGVIGWSMGGYGALLLARRLGPARTAAAVASSPALFRSHADARASNPRAFDGPDDFARNDVFAGLDGLRGIPLRVDCGTSDPFAPMARRLRDRLRPEGGMSGGCHDGAYWRRRLPGQLAFLGRHLASR